MNVYIQEILQSLAKARERLQNDLFIIGWLKISSSLSKYLPSFLKLSRIYSVHFMKIIFSNSFCWVGLKKIWTAILIFWMDLDNLPLNSSLSSRKSRSSRLGGGLKESHMSFSPWSVRTARVRFDVCDQELCPDGVSRTQADTRYFVKRNLESSDDK